MEIAECDFCKTELKDSSLMNCQRCGFPLNGTITEQSKFRSNNEKLEQLVMEADSALSWARFGMLWPWLGTIAIGCYYFLRAPMNLYACAADVLISSMFISLYFAVLKKPVAILAVAFIGLLMLVLFALFQANILYAISINWIQLIIPAILLIMYGNAWYLNWKLEKMLQGKAASTY